MTFLDPAYQATFFLHKIDKLCFPKMVRRIMNVCGHESWNFSWPIGGSAFAILNLYACLFYHVAREIMFMLYPR
jgi:hypothetical protein